MSGVNRCIFIGRLGRDPESRYTKDGTQVANFSIAVSENWKDSSGEKHEKTEWVSLVIFGKLAEVAGKYLHKGDQAYFEGKLQTRKYQDRENNEKRTTEVVVHSMTMLGGKKQDSGGNPGYSDHEPPPVEAPYEGSDSDIPF